MKKNRKKAQETKQDTWHGILKNLYLTFHRSARDMVNHPLISIMTIICTLILVWFAWETYWSSAKEQPTEMLQMELSKTMINIRVRIVNISEGCKGNNSYSQELKQNNEDRLNMLAELAALSTASDIEHTLGKAAYKQVYCFIEYNDELSARNNICEGEFLSETQMRQWESNIIYDIHHKSNKNITCLHGKYK